MKSRRAISLEEYVDFLRSNRQTDLTVSSLNKIVSMHGLRKTSKSRKKVLIDAVKTVDLMDPSRSTLKEHVSPRAFVELEDVIADLNALSWHECCTTSIKTFCKENSLATEIDSESQPEAPQWKAKRDRKGKEESKCHDGTDSSSGGMIGACSGDKTSQKRKRKNIPTKLTATSPSKGNSAPGERCSGSPTSQM